jgi:UDPglucose 6-dehydrogenase
MASKIGIIGNGWVGQGMQELFPDAITYVRDITKAPQEGVLDHKYTNIKTLINECDVAFICVPTPNDMSFNSMRLEKFGEDEEGDRLLEIRGEGKLDTSIVEECIQWCEAPLIVIRSTVNPGDCDRWVNTYNKKIVFQPEYLGETPQHPLLDTTQTGFMILGGRSNDRRKVIELYQEVYNANMKIRQVDLMTAEVIKLSENRAIAFKVAQCQELYDVCEAAGIDYYEVCQAVYGDDPRVTLWWTFVYPEKRGFNSKCIPKDIYAWCAWAESLGYAPQITRAILEKNKTWIEGR